MKTKTPEEFISDMGYGKGTNFTVGTVAYLMKEYTLSLLPSDEEIKKKHPHNFKGIVCVSGYYRKQGTRWLKQQILNKLNT